MTARPAGVGAAAVAVPMRIEDVDPEAVAQVGGKAAGLARLVRAGLPVPAAFVVPTAVYERCLAEAGIAHRLSALLVGIAELAPEAIERRSAQIRALFTPTALPADVRAAVAQAYAALGADVTVAVRSSGTAEDTATASFAGLHDTFLEIRGVDAVLDAVARCWGSMWSARAIAYRQTSGFDHAAARIAVVVQRMVDAQVSGVLFTANPLNARTNEFVVNASWGLGEGLVSGILDPDEIVLDAASLAVRRSRIGAKETQVVRDPAGGQGTVTQPVPPERRAELSLDAASLLALGELGRKVTAYHGGLPQDIEWAIADGQVQLLQARPITGVEFTWDEDVDAWQTIAEDDETLWTGGWAAEFWSGPITPLFYSFRAREMWARNSRTYRLLGFEDLMQLRWTKYRRGTAFLNTEVDSRLYRYLLPKALRGGALSYHPPELRARTAAEPMDVGRFVEAMTSLYTMKPWLGLLRWEDTLRSFMRDKVDHAQFASRETLRSWTDEQVRAYALAQVKLADEFLEYTALGAYLHAKPVLSLLSLMLRSWYKEGDAFTLQELISGLPQPSRLSEESRDLWRLAQRLAASPALVRLFEATPGAAFFEAVKADPQGRDFAEQYDRFVADHGHNGHAYRDIYFDRRIENPALDYESLRVLLKATDAVAPDELEARLVRKREETTARVLASIRAQSLGPLKATAFKLVHDWVMKFLLLRDDWRHSVNRVTLAKKWAFRELGLRAHERGLLDSPRDFYFLAERELYDVLDGKAPGPLVRAKVAARGKVFDRFLAHQEAPPAYLQGTVPVDLENTEADAGGDRFSGVSISRGVARGPARVIADLSDIGRIAPGDILVCNSTDPGWAPVFPLIRGLVLETGGMLSHGACLSREYGLAAVQLRTAMQRIPDGAIVEVSGDTGQVRLVVD